MCATFSDDDVGKTVKNTEDMAVGIVAAIDGETARVEPDPGATDSIEAALGWETDREDTVPIDESSVREITDDAIHLEADRSSDDGNDSIVESNEGTRERDVGPATGEIDGTEDEGREESEGESGAERPPEGDRTVTEERGREDDR